MVGLLWKVRGCEEGGGLGEERDWLASGRRFGNGSEKLIQDGGVKREWGMGWKKDIPRIRD